MLEFGFDNKNIPKCRQALATITSSLVSMCTGMAFGITGVILPQLKKDEHLDYDGSQDSWIASITTLSMVIGGLCSGSILDKYGRKMTHIIINAPIPIGWACIAFASSTTFVLIGRFICGIFSGAHRPITMVYIGEIADPKYRAAALFLPGLMLNVGVLFSHIVGSYCSWRISCIICASPAVISSVMFLFLKESPLWLINKGRIKEGEASFRWFRGTGEAAEDELKSVLQKRPDDKKNSVREVVDILCSFSFIKPFLIVVLIMINIQLSGVNVLHFYAHDIFARTLSGRVDPFIMMIVSDCVRGVVASVLCIFTKIIPRKVAYLISTFSLSVFLFILSYYLILGVSGSVWIPVVCLFMYIGFSGALIVLGWTFVPEVMPGKIRGFGSGLISSVSYLLLFITLKVTPGIMNNFGEFALYATFGTFSVVCGVLLSFILPDTSGKTLQFIEDGFSKKTMKKTEYLPE